jgi:N-acetyl-anhydromuramoyl-L-alanine amidase
MSEIQPAIINGWFTTATHAGSPNYDERPAGADVELIVLHHISLPAGNLSGDAVIDFFQNKLTASSHPPELAALSTVRVSAHFFVRRDGRVIQIVNTKRRAWHAGVSTWRGRENCNDFSVGIEVEGTGELAFEPAQYTALNDLISALKDFYPGIALSSHSEIAPGRKTDPGPSFDWSVLAHRMAI